MVVIRGEEFNSESNSRDPGSNELSVKPAPFNAIPFQTEKPYLHHLKPRNHKTLGF